MNTKLALATLAFCGLFGSAAALADKDSDADRAHPGTFVKDSAITTKIKTKLAADHVTSLGRIQMVQDYLRNNQAKLITNTRLCKTKAR